MRTSIPVATAALMLAMLITACNKKSDGDTAATNDANGQVKSACTPKRDEEADATGELVRAGTYCVCDVSDDGDSKHPGMPVKGKHLKVGDSVVIGQVGDAKTHVKLPTKEFDLPTSGHGKELKGDVSFPHEQVADPDAASASMASPVDVTHLVKIFRHQKYNEESRPASPQVAHCDSDTYQVIRIQFCFKDNTDKLICPENVENAHYGDVHAQN